MNPIAFRIPLPFLDTSLDFTWYGISIVVGVLSATLYASYAARRKGEDPNAIWDMFVYVLLSGVVGARIWYIVTATLGGSRYYLDNPLQMLNIRAGGTNIFGAILFGILAVVIFCRVKGINPWVHLDFIGPGVLLGQGLSRWGNYINQELYGPPTTLPWGISIDAAHRLPPWNDLSRFPLSTRFHPTFLYETIFNLLAFALLMFLLRRYDRWWRTGTVFGAYLVLHGIGRFIIEFFRPDQPLIAGTDISYSRLLAVLFVLTGALLVYWHRRQRESLQSAAPDGFASPTEWGVSDIAPADSESVSESLGDEPAHDTESQAAGDEAQKAIDDPDEEADEGEIRPA